MNTIMNLIPLLILVGIIVAFCKATSKNKYSPDAHNQQPRADSSYWKWDRIFIPVGIVGIIYSLNMVTAVETEIGHIANVSLINKKNNILFISVISFALGVIVNHLNRNKKPTDNSEGKES